jgi:hypothetical protein
MPKCSAIEGKAGVILATPITASKVTPKIIYMFLFLRTGKSGIK